MAESPPSGPWQPRPDRVFIDATKEEFEAGRSRRFGRANGELMKIPFWQAMVASEADAWTARTQFGATEDARNSEPVWNFSRYRQTHTIYRDSFIVSVGGAHEMSGDPDFMIFNDVVVRDCKGGIWIYGYPESDFPPVDGHTATLTGDVLVIVGGIGYEDYPALPTPVFLLDLPSMRITRYPTFGDSPGQIYEHRAYLDTDGILVAGGMRVSDSANPNQDSYFLNLSTRAWEKV